MSMALSVFTILILALLIDSSVRGVILAKFGENVSITCPCSRLISCDEKYVRWLKITDGTATVIDTVCEQTCRISQRKKDSNIELILRQVAKDDEGRYYCYSNMSSLLKLKGKGTFLQIDEPSNWTNNSEVTLFTALENNMVKQEFQRQTVLYCLVNGLLTPNISITWHSSKGQKEPGQTWVSSGSEGVTAGSRLHINMTNDKDSDTEEHNEMWWCEVYHGNITLRSNMMSLCMSTVSEWCPAMLYSAVALVLLCVLSLILLTSHWLLYLRKGNRVSIFRTSVSTSQLNQHPTSSGQASNRDTEVYSMLKFQPVNTMSASSPQNDRPASTSVTYASLNFQQPPPRPGRRHRGKPRVPD